MVNRWVLLASFFFIYVVILTTHWSTYINNRNDLFKAKSNNISKSIKRKIQFTLNCINGNMKSTCPKDNYLTTIEQDHQDYSSTCPEYFKWIHEDLKPWKSSKGITREMLERGQNMSKFRLVIIQGKAYVIKYENSFQTRDVFTIWGILQLLRLYPRKLPDLELLFQTDDLTVVNKEHFQGPKAMSPPPVFHYCGQKNAFDIVFPDWTFWGWAETGIRPWEATLQKIQEGNKKIKWKDRVPLAFWKGNTNVSTTRYFKFRKCNSSDQHDWKAHIYSLHWDKEIKQGFKNTKLEDQCTYRYKIYVEGHAWSVSEKYILACDSMTLFIEPTYYDFFSRSMVPRNHYWPISKQKSMCQEIKDAVEWGNANAGKAEAIGKAGTRFIEENLKMKFVYDYMFHLLSEYAKLMRFEPRIPEGAVEVCSESVACPMVGLWRQYMVESMVKSPSDSPPCTISSPYDDEN